MSDLITRAQWGARPPSGGRNALDPYPKGVAVHWNGPGCAAALATHDKCPGFLRGIQTFHMVTRGWSDIAYSLFACPHGYLFEGRGKGIGTAANGTNSGNRYYYAIYAMWGQGDGPIPDAMRAGIHDGIALCRSWGAGSEVTYHGRFLSTTCPGPELTADVKAGRFNRQPQPAPTAQKDVLDMTPDELRKIIRECRENVERTFNRRNYVAGVLDVYRGLGVAC